MPRIRSEAENVGVLFLVVRWHQKTTLMRNMKHGRTRTVWSNLDAMTKDIMSLFLRLSTAKEI